MSDLRDYQDDDDFGFGATMQEPSVCECGQIFDLDEGNPCSGDCHHPSASFKVYCNDCVDEPWSECPQCRGEG
jgi:hypothetical protein